MSSVIVAPGEGNAPNSADDSTRCGIVKVQGLDKCLELYALVLAMIDDEKAWVIGTRRIDNRQHLTVRTIAGDLFEIARPPISEEVEAPLSHWNRLWLASLLFRLLAQLKPLD